MKIAVFTDSFFPGWGGTEYATYYLCRDLIALGHEILLFAPDYHREQSFTEFEVCRVKSLKLTQSDMAVLLGPDYGKIFRKVKAFDPDVLYYCSATGMAKCAVKLSKALKKPVVATIHTKFKEAFYDGTKSRLITHCVIRSLASKLNRTDYVLTVSNDMREALKKYGCKKQIGVIRNGSDVSVTKSDLKERDGVFRFMFSGRLVKVKNIQFSIRSLGLLKRQRGFSNFRFMLVGSGNYKKTLLRLARKEDISENLEFYGYVSDKEKLAALYRKADLFLFPSTFDSDGLVICEAARQGTPSLTLKGVGAGERITDNVNGFLADYDVRSFADRIYEIVSDADLLSRVSNNTDTVKTASWRDVALEYEQVFRNAIHRGGGSYSEKFCDPFAFVCARNRPFCPRKLFYKCMRDKCEFSFWENRACLSF